MESLSMKERLILANQYEILSRLSQDEDEKQHFENIREAFSSGYTRYYDLATEHFSEEVSNEECKFVVDVLDLYRDLYYSREHTQEIKDAIEEREVLFKGFDLNDNIESKYYSFYSFLVNNLGRYQEINELMEAGKIEDFNSHGFGPTMEQLKEMILKREEIRNRDEFHRHDYLTLEEVKEILNK